MNPTEDRRSNEAESVQWQEIQDMFDGEKRCDERPFREMLDDFRKDLDSHPYVRGWRKEGFAENRGWPRIVRRLSIPAAGAVAATVLIGLVLLVSSPGLSWAQVAQRFAEVEFMHASIYNKQDGLSAPEHIELWAGRGCKVRIRMGDKLIFAEKGKVFAAFDLKTRKQTEPGQIAERFVGLIGSDEVFSLDTIIRSVSMGRAPDRVPIRNANAVISEDLAVFDLDFKEDSSLQWCRFWTLKKSGLPVRIRMWDPYDAASVEVLIDYSKPQSEAFFDPKAFASALASIKTDQLNLAYLYLKDPGGKSYAPGIADEHEAISITTTTIDGEPFSLADYRDKNLLLYFFDRDVQGRRWTRFEKLEQEHGSLENLKIIVVATDKDKAAVQRGIDARDITATVLHEPGKGMYNSLARALGVKDAGQVWLITGGKAYRVRDGLEKMVDLVCNGLTFENRNRLNRFITLSETTKDRMFELCGKPDEIETVDGRELWTYRFTSADGLYTGSTTLRFNEEGKCSGHSYRGRLIEPSNVSIEFSEAFWRSKVEAVFGTENMPEKNSDHHIEILIAKGDRGSGYILGGGHPRTDIVPGKKVSREVPPGTYGIKIRLMYHKNTYKQLQETEVLEEFVVGRQENVEIHFGDSDLPDITRAAYAPEQVDNAAESRKLLLKRPDFKKMYKDGAGPQINYDDPKYLPWQIHLKEIAARYESRPLPERMELTPKQTNESYRLKMFPKNLPGYDGYSAVSVEGDLKGRFVGHSLGLGVMRWPEATASVEMNHDLVYRDGTTQAQRGAFILKQMGYKLEKVTEERKVFVATYDGRELPDPEKISAPDPAGWGPFTARTLVDTLTRTNNRDMQATGPVFLDETGLPSKPAPGQDHKDIAITMEMPSFTTQSFETLRPWFKDTFGISFTEETRAMEILVVTRGE